MGKFHVAASGKNAGFYVPCHAEHGCKLVQADGKPSPHTVHLEEVEKHNEKLLRAEQKRKLDTAAARREARFGRKLNPTTGEVKQLHPEERREHLEAVNHAAARSYVEESRRNGVNMKTPEEKRSELEQKIAQQIEKKTGYYYDKWVEDEKRRTREETFSLTLDPDERVKLRKQWAVEDAYAKLNESAAAPVFTDEQISVREEALKLNPHNVELRHLFSKKPGFAGEKFTTGKFIESKKLEPVQSPEDISYSPSLPYIKEAVGHGWKVFRDARTGDVHLTKYSVMNKGLCVLHLPKNSPEATVKFFRAKVTDRVQTEEASLSRVTARKQFSMKTVVSALNKDCVSGRPAKFADMVIVNGKATHPENVPLLRGRVR